MIINFCEFNVGQRAMNLNLERKNLSTYNGCLCNINMVDFAMNIDKGVLNEYISCIRAMYLPLLFCRKKPYIFND
jgi:hypothetical protein